MDVTYDLSANDILAYWLHLYRHSPPFRAQYWLGFVLAPLGGAWLALHEGKSLAWQIAIFIVMTTVFAALYVVLFRLFLRGIVGSLAKISGGHGLGPHTLTLNPDGVRETGPKAEHAHRWPAVQSLQESPDHFFLLVGFGMAYVVPKRAFEQAQERQHFCEAVNTYRAGGPTTG